MGPKDKQPEPPGVEWANLPDSHVFVSKRTQECNYLQAMEGGIDTSHVSYVHRYEVDDDPMHQGTKALDYIKADGNVIFEIEKTPVGLTLFGRRNGEADSYYYRITQWLFPWYTLIPPFGEHALEAYQRELAGPGQDFYHTYRSTHGPIIDEIEADQPGWIADLMYSVSGEALAGAGFSLEGADPVELIRQSAAHDAQINNQLG
jgi:hypothetical protein